MLKPNSWEKAIQVTYSTGLHKGVPTHCVGTLVHPWKTLHLYLQILWVKMQR